jgi:hypothetical protein
MINGTCVNADPIGTYEHKIPVLHIDLELFGK